MQSAQFNRDGDWRSAVLFAVVDVGLNGEGSVFGQDFFCPDIEGWPSRWVMPREAKFTLVRPGRSMKRCIRVKTDISGRPDCSNWMK
jgi:hypothetical protein